MQTTTKSNREFDWNSKEAILRQFIVVLYISKFVSSNVKGGSFANQMSPFGGFIFY